jgi:hypothetical protein
MCKPKREKTTDALLYVYINFTFLLQDTTCRRHQSPLFENQLKETLIPRFSSTNLKEATTPYCLGPNP